MNKAEFLKKRLEVSAPQTVYKREMLCYRCYWLQENCRCNLIKAFDTETRFILLMHPMEAKKEKLGTGRITQATLQNSKIIVGIDFTQHKEVNSIIQDSKNFCMVLYPGEKSINISTDDISPLVNQKNSGRQLVVFLIDGTWPCAKKMMTQSLNIRSLPRISFTNVHESIFEIKEQPAAYCLSTLESIHVFLNEAHRRGLESLPDSPQDNLIVVFKSMIDFMLACAIDPNRSNYRGLKTGYTKREDRVKRKKWSMRGIILKG